MITAMGAIKSSVFHDKDGSVSGVPNSFIVINDGIAIDEACEVKPTWNAAVCKGDVGRMTIGAGRSAVAVVVQVVAVLARRRAAPAVAGGPAARGGGPGAGGPGAARAEPAVRRSRRRSCCWCQRLGRARSRACAAASRSQPQWQGFPVTRSNQRTSGYRVSR